MKRFIYSKYTKAAAAVLAALFVSAAALAISTAISHFGDGFVYRFESSFDSSVEFSALLSEPADAVFEAYDEEKPHSDGFYRELRDGLSDVDKNIEYYISINGERIASKDEAQSLGNMDFKSVDKYFKNMTFHTLDILKPSGEIQQEGSNERITWYLPHFESLNTEDEIHVYSAVSSSCASKFAKTWKEQADYVKNILTELLLLGVGALLMLVYLVCVCGRNSVGERIYAKGDRLWTEFNIVVLVVALIAAVGVDVVAVDVLHSGVANYIVHFSVGAVTFFGSLIALAAFLAIVRSIKNREFFKNLLVFKIICAFFDFGKKTSGKCKALAAKPKKTAVILCALLLVYTALIGIFGIFTTESAVGLLLGIAAFALACFFIFVRSNDCDEIKKAAHEIRRGNLTCKADGIKSEDLKILAEDINSIGCGLNESVAQKIKAERMKTELITNVSHDLKTPLTSIISYTQLLSDMQNLPDEAKDYVGIISKKAQRLKNLTQDLFDISKVQSGNEVINTEKLDISLLVSQSLGEHNGEIEKSNLEFCTDLQSELFVNVDGRKMSRVVDNLISNILKYSLDGTRVYVSSRENSGKVYVEFKNISASPMNFSTAEITERFVRGDASRTKEGNGLGLAIAKEYTHACGGRFMIFTDGDLFKAVLEFSVCE